MLVVRTVTRSLRCEIQYCYEKEEPPLMSDQKVWSPVSFHAFEVGSSFHSANVNLCLYTSIAGIPGKFVNAREVVS